jgi:glucose-1-phosphatase
MSERELKIIFFDLGGVLVTVKTGHAVQKLAEALGASVSEAETYWKQRNLLHLQYECGALTTEQWLAMMLLEFEQLDRLQILTIFTCMFEINSEVVKIAEKLSSSFVVSLLSNTNPLHFYRIMCDYPELHFFQDPVASFQVNALKPGREIYRRACERLAYEPRHCALIDDRIENVQAANDFGMLGIHYQSPELLKTELRNIDINFI